jgi:ABC-type transporter Mla maintaining outer membrane lipid asymmetry permease subunit MlaE
MQPSSTHRRQLSEIGFAGMKELTRRYLAPLVERNRTEREYIRQTWSTLAVEARLWALVGFVGGACLALAGFAAFLDHRAIALISLGVALAILALCTIRAIVGGVRRSR